MIVKVNIARVFVNNSGDFGNPVGIILDEKNELNENQQQEIATKLNFSETVFIKSLGEKPLLSIFNPQHKVTFAGHAVLGTTVFINDIFNKNLILIKCGNEEVAARREGKLTYITAPLSIMPSWNFEQINIPTDVENLSKEIMSQKEHSVVWAWINEKKGLIRARTFAPDWGIPEDQANGSGSMLLAVKLKRSIEILHGKGSVIFAKPIDDTLAEVGGMVVMDSEKEITLE